jgi:hypothetical protein
MSDGKDHMSLGEGHFWIALSIFSTGLYFVKDDHLWGGFLVAAGAVWLIYSLRHELTAPKSGRLWIVGIVMTGALITTSFDIYERWTPGPPLPIAASDNAPSALDADKEIKAALETEKQQNIDLQAQLKQAQNDREAARNQLRMTQQQEQLDRSNDFSFPNLPIEKRKLTHSEAVDLIDKLNAFPDVFKLLATPDFTPLIPSVVRIAPPLPKDFGQRQAMVVDAATKIRVFKTTLEQKISDASNFKTEIEEMLGGVGWSYWLDQLDNDLQIYVQATNKIAARNPPPRAFHILTEAYPAFFR